MNKIIILLLSVVIHSISFAQFEEEIKKIETKGGYFLGHYNISDSTTRKTTLLPDSVDLINTKAFYVVVTVYDYNTSVYIESRGGSHNLLWTDEIIGIKRENDKTHFLLRIYWEYSEERFKRCNLCSLGSFHFAVYRQNDIMEYSKEPIFSIRWYLKWKRRKL